MKESGGITRPLRDPNDVPVFKKLPATTRRRRRPIVIYTLTLCVSLILLIAQLCLIAFSAISIAQGSSNKNNLQQRQPKVSWEPCNQSTLCPVFENDNVGTLLKVMTGVRAQVDTRSSIPFPFSRHFKHNCEHFTIANGQGEPLKWVGDFYARHGESDGSVKIRENGTYGLYNIFTLRIPRYYHTTERAEIVHRVHLERALDGHTNNPHVILFERNIVLSPELQSFNSSNFFDFMYLRAGDRLYPSISNSSYVYSMQQANMWGVFEVR